MFTLSLSRSPPSLFSVTDVSDIILQAVTTTGVEKMKQSFVVVMVFVPLWVSSRVFTLGAWLCPTKCFGLLLTTAPILCARYSCVEMCMCVYMCVNAISQS